jgi:hypothetical protein
MSVCVLCVSCHKEQSNTKKVKKALEKVMMLVNQIAESCDLKPAITCVSVVGLLVHCHCTNPTTNAAQKPNQVSEQPREQNGRVMQLLMPQNC